jgi:organic hydroperoxide reductase OsmC/OhrA
VSGKAHHYPVTVTWTGNTGEGTTTFRAYRRDHEISVDDKPTIPASSDPAFRGDPTRYNPEELFVASLSQCHMLWYLHLCADNGINVVAYVDRAEGVMVEDAIGGGRFTQVTLRPEITLAPGSDADLADTLHHGAHEKCFIANSVSIPVDVEAAYLVEAIV